MSTLTTRDVVVQGAGEGAASANAKPLPLKREGFSLSRLLAWYRSAVLSPATNDERAEWQKNSF